MKHIDIAIGTSIKHKKDKKKHKKRKFILVFITFAAIGILIFSFADRYLIDHVQVQLKIDSKGFTQTTDSDSESAIYDNWNYTDVDTEIHIEKVTEGERVRSSNILCCRCPCIGLISFGYGLCTKQGRYKHC